MLIVFLDRFARDFARTGKSPIDMGLATFAAASQNIVMPTQIFKTDFFQHNFELAYRIAAGLS